MTSAARCLALALALTATPALADDAAPSFAKDIQPFLKQHCLSCHGPDKQAFGMRFDHLERYRGQDGPLWTKVYEALAAGSMPPKARPQPADAERRRVQAWIETEQRAGGGAIRRLNRREFSAALQDVTGLAVDYAHALPGDGRLGGFDTGADALQDAADSVEQAMKITRRAVDALRFLDPAPGKPLTLNLRDAADPRKALDAWKAEGVVVRARGFPQPGQGLLLEPRWVGERDALTFNLPAVTAARGVLRVKLVVSAYKPLPKLPNPHLWVDLGGKDIDFREITGTLDKPEELVYEVQLDDLAIGGRGLNINLVNRVEIPYAVAGFPNEDLTKPDEVMIPGGTGLFRPQFDRQKTPPAKQPAPLILLQRVEIEPDYVAAWPPASWQANLGRLGDNPESAQQLLQLWIERAWRRPVADAEQERFRALYRKLRAQGMSFDEALRAVFQSVVLAGGFRYLPSPVDPHAVIAPHALASRLSFMLWGAPPDAELRRLAAAGKLRDSAVLDAQVDRLLADPRCEQFFRPFVLQWLEMEQPITIASSHIRKQDFRWARYLKESMRHETTGYVARLFVENRPARELIASDWTLMNDALALHYGYEDIDGGRLRPVALRANDPRGGGILGHAGIQSMLTWMGGNWVIYRGAWAMRHILDDPPPPPPLEVPELNPSEAANRGKSFKELLKLHQEDSNCTVCHRKMDPLGFAFQNFDISGRWRDVEHEHYAMSDLDGKIAWTGVGATRPVDTVGRLPRGEEFKTFAECKQLIVKHYQADVVRGLLKNLVVYATGRLPDVHDLAEMRAIMQAHEPKGYPLRDVLKAVLRSKAILER
ncbi:MAG: DUF1592 domain-containing protein [Planctomycetia bacterium]|nr:DUF1592 domain-containing protein [Planctomycetia bacterium]